MINKQNIVQIIAVIFAVIIFVFGGDGSSGKKPLVFEDPQVTSIPQEIFHGDTSKKQVIFTFDAGSSNESGDKILEVLANHHVKGTFFLTGKTIETYPDFVKDISVAGHEIFNHTYDHPDLTKLSDEEIGEELTKMEMTLRNTIGITSKPYFRAPFGSLNERVLAAASELGYQSVFWTVDADDWRESQGETSAQVKEKILSSVAPGTIYLMHVGDTITGEILDDVFTEIESRGYKIVSLAQGL